jgi:hypothetical protein
VKIPQQRKRERPKTKDQRPKTKDQRRKTKEIPGSVTKGLLRVKVLSLFLETVYPDLIQKQAFLWMQK